LRGAVTAKNQQLQTQRTNSVSKRRLKDMLEDEKKVRRRKERRERRKKKKDGKGQSHFYEQDPPPTLRSFTQKNTTP